MQMQATHPFLKNRKGTQLSRTGATRSELLKRFAGWVHPHL